MDRKRLGFQLSALGVLLAYIFCFEVILSKIGSTGVSDLLYYALECLLVFLIGGLSIFVLMKQREYSFYTAFRFKISYPFFILFLIFLGVVWSIFSSALFQQTQNGDTLRAVYTETSGVAYILMRYIYGCLLAPITEELIFRGLIMSAFHNLKKYYLDVLISASLFGFIHTLGGAFIFTDFLRYFVLSLLFCWTLRYTKSIYWAIFHHVAWNTFLTIIGVLALGY